MTRKIHPDGYPSVVAYHADELDFWKYNHAHLNNLFENLDAFFHLIPR